MQQTIRLPFVVAVVALAACNQVVPPTGPPIPGAVDATVFQVNIEGGCWSLKTVTGQTYQPINMPDSLRRDGLPVSVRFSQRNDLVSYCMLGPMVEIEAIRAR